MRFDPYLSSRSLTDSVAQLSSLGSCESSLATNRTPAVPTFTNHKIIGQITENNTFTRIASKTFRDFLELLESLLLFIRLFNINLMHRKIHITWSTSGFMTHRKSQ